MCLLPKETGPCWSQSCSASGSFYNPMWTKPNVVIVDWVCKIETLFKPINHSLSKKLMMSKCAFIGKTNDIQERHLKF